MNDDPTYHPFDQFNNQLGTDLSKASSVLHEPLNLAFHISRIYQKPEKSLGKEDMRIQKEPPLPHWSFRTKTE